MENNSSVNDEKERKMSREKRAPVWISRVLFCWMFPLFYWGSKRDLDECDLPPARDLYGSNRNGDLLERNWLAEQRKKNLKGTKPSIVEVLLKTFGWSYLTSGLLQFVGNGLETAFPVLFSQLLLYWSVNSTMTIATATYYAIALIAVKLCSIFLIDHGNLLAQQQGMKIRVALSSLIYRKIMRMHNCSLGEMSAGKVLNILSNDLMRSEVAFYILHYAWIMPLQLIVICYLGYRQAGGAALVGLAAMCVIALPIQSVLGRLLGRVRMHVAEKTDQRIRVMSEVISGIQVIKMYTWEIPFQKVVSEYRAAEMKWVRTANLVRTIFMGFTTFTGRTALFLSILTYILLGNTISANVIYPLQQFINIVEVNISMILPVVISYVSEMLVTLKRVQQFLDLEDRPDLLEEWTTSVHMYRNLAYETSEDEKKAVQPLSYRPTSDMLPDVLHNDHSSSDRKQISDYLEVGGDTAVELVDVSASWTNDPGSLALSNLSLRIRKGGLCAFIGPVGSGKSSILQLLLKELPAMKGHVSVNGSVSYASQEPWLFPKSVRENILFGLPFDPDKYKTVCRACALEKDFTQFPFGDQTLVGERGVSMSGGQRARVNLARAVYREADVYLLDDPLSAVDANVGRQLFEGCINGYLRGRTRILVTHQIHFLKDADDIVAMNEGALTNMGTFNEFISSRHEFATLLTALQGEENKEIDSLNSDSNENLITDKKILTKTLSTVSLNGENGMHLQQFEAQKMMSEQRQSGNLKWEVISGYIRAGGSWNFVHILFMFTLATAAGASVDYWISYWTNAMATQEQSLNGTKTDSGLNVQVGAFTTGQYLMVCGGLILLTIIITQLRAIPFANMCTSASQNIHNNMFSNMIKGIMRFFNTSSSGQILNRFTKDIGALDEVLPKCFADVVQMHIIVLFILVLNAISLYLTLILSAVLLVLIFLFVNVYMKLAQGIKRLESTSKSPVFGMVTTSFKGIATIRSLGAQAGMVAEFDEHQDLHTAALNTYLCGGATLALYLNITGVIYLAAMIFAFLYIDLGSMIAIGYVGMAVTQTTTLTSLAMQYGAKMLVELIAQLTSVERVLEYTKIENETNLLEGEIQAPPTWPKYGRIVFNDLSLRYAPEGDTALKNLDIVVESGWKVGVVGRTGAGKSSLISALFRFAYSDGTITIDGLDTALVSRQALRSKISIIPQEPVLFSATMRYNLDPFNIYNDNELWRALELVEMKSAVPSLDYLVTEGGANFSVGQRQLLCLARAVLRSNKILIMDEATANVDPYTDNFIQQTIRKQFASCTVLTIAHRLNTVMDSDRVLVMSFGRVLEFDHPYNLLLRPDGAFSAMLRETGENNAAHLFQVAKEAFFRNDLQEH